MKFEKKYSAEMTARMIGSFILRYVDREKLQKRGLLWNSLKDEADRRCLPFSEAASLAFFSNKEEEALLLYDERERALYQVKWAEVVHAVNALEPWEENVDLLILDPRLEWFLAVTHEDLLTVCGGTLASKE